MHHYVCENGVLMIALRVALFFLIVVPPSFAAEASGFVQAQGCGSFNGYRLQFENLDGKKLAKPIALTFPESYYWENSLNDPWRVSAPECSASACEPGAHGTVRITRVDRHFSLGSRRRIISSISGEFSIELQNGRKIDAAFRAKVRKPERKIICE